MTAIPVRNQASYRRTPIVVVLAPKAAHVLWREMEQFQMGKPLAGNDRVVLSRAVAKLERHVEPWMRRQDERVLELVNPSVRRPRAPRDPDMVIVLTRAEAAILAKIAGRISTFEEWKEIMGWPKAEWDLLQGVIAKLADAQ